MLDSNAHSFFIVPIVTRKRFADWAEVRAPPFCLSAAECDRCATDCLDLRICPAEESH